MSSIDLAKDSNAENINDDLSRQYLTFFMDNQIMGIPLINVEQIVQIQNITPVPETPEYFKGVMDLRGNLIPLIDMRLRLKRDEAEYNDKTAIIICIVKNSLIGYIVDSVDEVVTLQDDYIKPMPRVNAASNTDYATGIARYPVGDKYKIIILIDVDKLNSDEDLVLIDDLQE